MQFKMTLSTSKDSVSPNVKKVFSLNFINLEVNTIKN